MATKDQYEFFRGLYEEEERTSEQLESRAKVYLSVLTAFLVAFLLKANEVATSAKTLGVPWPAIVAVGVLLSLSLLLITLAMRIRDFEAAADGVEIIEAFGDEQPTDEDFFDDRVADYAVASSKNRAVNNKIAQTLQVAGWFLFAGLLLMLGVIAFALRSKQ